MVGRLYRTLSIPVCIRPFIKFLHKPLYLTYLKDISTKFAGQVGLENMSVVFVFETICYKHYGCDSDALKLEILQLALSNLHKRHMTRKASMIVILA